MSQDKNSYVAVPTLTKEAAIFSDELDKREIIETTNTPSFFSRIGQLRMDFDGTNDKKISFNGTASVFCLDTNANKAYAVTCAHNLKYFDPLQSKANCCVDATFERRKTTKNGSESMKEYKVCDQWIHPNYDPSKAVSSNDLAIIAFKDDDHYFKNVEQEMNDLDEKLEIEDYTHIYGYPVCKKGELWGQSKKADIAYNEDTNLLQYDIQTTGGQSGSPIIRITQDTQTKISEKVGSILMIVFVVMLRISYVLGFRFPASFDLAVLCVIITFIAIIYGDNKLNGKIVISKQCNIVGIHTTGNDTGNIGVKLTDKSLEWIKKQIKAEEMTQDSTHHDDDSFYCLKNTPFL